MGGGIMNALHTLLAVLAVVLTVTGPDGLWLVTCGVLAALTGWRVFVAYHGEVRTSSTHPAIIRVHDPQSEGTCVWIGRFDQAISEAFATEPALVYRKDVKLHHCHNPRANDATIRQALVDRFAKGQPNHGKGTKAQPGWFYGFRADVWQAYALAVYAADQLLNGDRDHITD